SPSTSPQTLPHTTQTKEQTATQSLPHTTQTFDNSSSSNMTPPQYYYPSPQETPWMTPDSTTYEPGTHDTLLGQRLYPDLADIQVVLQEEGLEDPKDVISEGEFVLLFRTGHYDYLENIDDPRF